MAGWFSETNEEKRARLALERKTAEREEKRKKRIEKRRADKEAFEKEVQAEVERNLGNNSDELKKERLERLNGQSSFLNGALGQEFAYRGGRVATPWMKSPGLEVGIGRAKVQKGEELDNRDSDKSDSNSSNSKSIRLSRPF